MKKTPETANLAEVLDRYAPLPKEYPLPEREGWERYAVLQRQRLLSRLGAGPAEAPLHAETLKKWTDGGLVLEEVAFDSAGGVRIAGTLLRPADQSGPLPAVAALHDHSGFYAQGRQKVADTGKDGPVLRRFKEQSYSGRSWANDLALRGYVVLAIDAFYFGERSLHPWELSEQVRARLPYEIPADWDTGSPEQTARYHAVCQFYEKEIAKHILISGISWPGILLQDDRRSIDYLCSRPEVDPARIGCCGLSLGGFRSALLCGLDPRIRCAVVAGWMNPLRLLRHQNLKDHTFMLYIPFLLQDADLPDITGLHAPNPLLVQHCLQDDLFLPEGMAAANARLEEYYRLLNASERLCCRSYDNPHQFNLQMQQDAFRWLDRWLGR